MSKLDELALAVQGGRSKKVPELVQASLDEGNSASDILNKGMIDAMAVVGEKFSTGEIFVPEMLVAAKAMKAGMEVLKPYLSEGSGATKGKCIIGTVAGDLHDIGKNLVSIMIESAGFEVIDLGVDVPAEKFVETVKENPDCKIVACSALLTTTMESLRNTVKVITDSGVRDRVKVIVGGAPITQAFADEIGADGYSVNAPEAAKLASSLV